MVKQNSILISIFQIVVHLIIGVMVLILLGIVIIFLFLLLFRQHPPSNHTVLKDIRANIATIEEYNIVKIYSFKYTSLPDVDDNYDDEDVEVLHASVTFEGDLSFTYEDKKGKMIEKVSKISVYYSYNREKYKYDSCRFLDYQEEE